VTLSEARLSFLSHALLKAVTGEKLGRVRNERLFLAETKRGLTEGFSLDGRLDQLARARMPKRPRNAGRRADSGYGVFSWLASRTNASPKEARACRRERCTACSARA